MYSQIMNPITNQVHDGVIKRESDGAFIPLVEGNRDYAEYKKWLAAGNTPNPPPLTPSPPGKLANIPIAADDPVAQLVQRVRKLEQSNG